jgi:nucleoside-diphosphate kinase
MIERTFVMVKPDATARGISGEIIARFERRGFQLVGLKKTVMTRAAAEEHYDEHRDRPFFAELVEFITSGPVVMMAIEGEGCDRRVPHDDGHDEPARCRAWNHPR